MNRYNPHIHHRRSIRLKGHDYAQAGFYFVTICCKDNMCRFGRVENGEMILNEFGTVARDEWMKLAERFPNIEIDVFQIMPNHKHGIIILHNTSLGATHAVAPRDVLAPFDGMATMDELATMDAVAHMDELATMDAVAQMNELATIDGVGQNFAVDPNIGAVQNIGNAQNNGVIWAGANRAVANRAVASPAPKVSDIVGAYKSLVSNGCLSIYKSKNEIAMGTKVAPTGNEQMAIPFRLIVN